MNEEDHEGPLNTPENLSPRQQVEKQLKDFVNHANDKDANEYKALGALLTYKKSQEYFDRENKSTGQEARSQLRKVNIENNIEINSEDTAYENAYHELFELTSKFEDEIVREIGNEDKEAINLRSIDVLQKLYNERMNEFIDKQDSDEQKPTV